MYTFEFRHPTWYVDEVYDLLNKHKIALVITDLNGKQSPEVVTGKFVYLRLHGPKKAYQGTYGTHKLKELKKKIDQWKNAKYDVYCYFDNDEKGYAVQDATEIKKYY